VGSRLSNARVLPYSQRLEMVDEAQRHGIGRFEANLIIAAVLHRAGIAQETTAELKPTPSRRGWLLPALTIAFVQCLIVAGAWWVLR
jgi:hypothetical protein